MGSLENPIDLITPPSIGGLHHPIYLCTPTPEKPLEVPTKSETAKVVLNRTEVMESNTITEQRETFTTMQVEVGNSHDKPTKGARKQGSQSKHNKDAPRRSAA
ncbi:hypothetical protein GOP47_0014882 [Adiantum capillus-veneris]|uniref:Uncharacterized protein n=1 Tax=Adiantum capillus-veneris TaxID=13818 RepID=A0A9D4ZCW2_ADICA|nr:hypothetical protein GOP47_0014882 [Adiantum capillus-veneris]